MEKTELLQQAKKPTAPSGFTDHRQQKLVAEADGGKKPSGGDQGNPTTHTKVTPPSGPVNKKKVLDGIVAKLKPEVSKQFAETFGVEAGEKSEKLAEVFLDEAKSMKLGGGGRFAKLKAELAKKGVKDPKAAAAAIGRKKLGDKKMASLADKGKEKAEKK